MITYVWAVSEDNAIEQAYECRDYKDLEEAKRKVPPYTNKVLWRIYKVEVTRVDHQRQPLEELQTLQTQNPQHLSQTP